MSLIFGINLCDRIYISGDNRLCLKEGEILKEKKDKIIKIVPFSSNITAVFAGDVNMSVWIIEKILTLIKPALDIRSLRKDVKNLITPLVNEYWDTTNSKAKIAIIFGGLNPNKKKQFNLSEIYKKIKQYSDFKKEAEMNMKPALFNEVMRSNGGPLRYPEPSDSHVFSIQIFPPSGFLIEDAEWGEYLAYGSNGITKEKLNPVTLGIIEFSGGDAGHDNMVITGILNEVIKVTKEETIGKTFVNTIVADGLSGVLGGGVFRANLKTMKTEFLSEVFRKDGKFFSRNDDGSITELISIKDYSGFGDLEI